MTTDRRVPSTSLASLSPELMASIVLYLGCEDILQCRMVCSSWKELVDNHRLIQYKDALSRAGMENGSPGQLNISARLAKLRWRQQVLSSLKRANYLEPQGGRTFEGRSGKFVGGLFACITATGMLFVTSSERISERRLDFDSLDILDFVINPAQDLLVFIMNPRDRRSELQVHLLSLQSGQRHPQATQTLVHSVESSTDPSRYSFTLYASDVFLALIVRSDNVEFLVWDWRTGVTHLHVKPCELDSFAFLTSHLVVFAFACSIWTVDLSAARQESTSLSDLKYLCKFQYPKLAPDVTSGVMSLFATPEHQIVPSPPLPFQVSRTDRLLVVSLVISVTIGRLVDYFTLLLFVPMATLLSRVNSLTKELHTFGHDSPWLEWGPSSRLLITSRTGRMSPLFGMSFVAVSDIGVRFFDFNPVAVEGWSVEDIQAVTVTEYSLIIYSSKLSKYFIWPFQDEPRQHHGDTTQPEISASDQIPTKSTSSPSPLRVVYQIKEFPDRCVVAVSNSGKDLVVCDTHGQVKNTVEDKGKASLLQKRRRWICGRDVWAQDRLKELYATVI
ncbi:hypothetical protein C8T65DRAFT_632282 [Cerioporus squamosus]|nr:hypothetical protein C8T65DRAFT_632282 [Cerioporus squamosus]